MKFHIFDKCHIQSNPLFIQLLLDKKLRAIDKANKHTSYINAPWTDMYLKDRRPVTFTHCPGLGVGLPWNVDLIGRVTNTEHQDQNT